MNRQSITIWSGFWLVLLCGAMTATAGPDKGNLVFYLSCDDAANPVDGSADPATVVLHGSLPSVRGQFGTQALDFNGNKANRIQVLNNPKLDGMSALTIEAWIRPRNLRGREGMIIVSKRVANSTADSYNFFLWGGGGRPYISARLNNHNGANRDVVGKTIIQYDTWYHAAFVFDGQASVNERMKTYVNGVLDGTLSHPDTSVDRGNASLWIGDEGEYLTGNVWDGALDEIGIWNAALTADEIGQLMVHSKASLLRTGTAGNPQPTDGAIHSDTWVTLSWTPGYFAASHDVYVGDNFDDVNNAALDSEIFRGNQAGTYVVAGIPGFAYPDGLVPGTTYYWRIDEVNGADPNSPWKGDVWSFLVPPETAYDPAPADGSRFIDAADIMLTWSPGFGARLHTVYFGDDFDTVNSAIDGIPVALAAYKPGPPEADTTYYWRVDEYDGITIYKGNIWSFTTSKEGGGLRGDYYKGMNFQNFVLTRTDPQINFNWSDGAPDPAVGPDQFSVRWTGEVEAAYSETYTFYTRTDDGVRLWVDGLQLVDAWIDQMAREYSGELELVAGNTYSLVMEMYENGGGAVAELRWSSPSTPKQLVPRAALTPAK